METNFPTPEQVHSFEQVIKSFVTVLPHVGLLVGAATIGICLAIFLFTLSLRLLDCRRLLKQKAIFLELTPPAFTDKTPMATQKLFSVLHGLEETRSWSDKLLQRKAVFSLEVVSSREQGIRYVVCIAESDRNTFEKNIASYLPDVRVKVVGDYLVPTTDYRAVKVLDFKQTNHFAYPLQTHESLTESDPIAYLTGAMTQLAPNEQMVFQIVASPAKVRATNAIRKKILNNEHLLEHLNGKSKQVFPVHRIFYAINSMLFGVTDAVSETYHGSTSKSFQASQKEAQNNAQVAKRLRPARTLSAFELELVESIHRKIEQPLFRSNVRALVVMRNNKVKLRE